MTLNLTLLILLVLMVFGYFLGRARAKALATRDTKGRMDLAALPTYYGFMVVIWTGLPALILLAIWSAFGTSIVDAMVLKQMPQSVQQLSASDQGLMLNEIRSLVASNSEDYSRASAPYIAEAALHYTSLVSISALLKTVIILAVALACLLFAWRKIAPYVRARHMVERVIRILMILCAAIAILTTIGIVFSVLFESLRFFQRVNIFEFLFGMKWSPQTALRADQVGGSGAFGAVPLFVGTLLISIIALSIAVPFGLFSAIYLSEYANRRFRAVAKPVLEILAGIPTVVYGFFAALTVAPFIHDLGEAIGLTVAAESALAAGIVMGIMIIPFVSSLSDDVISAVPQAMRDGSFGLGATRNETIRKVIIPAALPGIVGGVLLAASRAIGETMIVVMAAGLRPHAITVQEGALEGWFNPIAAFNPLEAVTTVTVQIVTLLTGDQEFDSPKTLSAFALGLGLFAITLLLNYIALKIIRRYREQYD